jgi:O-antigen/teichoic acid export membrane protein
MKLELPAIAAGATPHVLGRRVLSLGIANGFDVGLQFLLPVLLARSLESADFARYRLLWLVTGTVMAIVTQAMAGSLYYFLPRSAPRDRRLYVNQAVLYLASAGALAAWAVSGTNPWTPSSVRALDPAGWIVPAFVFLWVVGSLLDLIGAAEERIRFQARTVIVLSVLRVAAVGTAVAIGTDFRPVLLALLAHAGVKVAVLLWYIGRHHGLGPPFVRRDALADQLRQSTPFGVAGTLFGLRGQADQWVANALFDPGRFASLSIAALLSPLVNLCRQSVAQVLLPSVSRLQAAGDVRGMLELNSRGSVMVATIIYPLLAFAFVFADEIVAIVYTTKYGDAAPVIRVYALGLWPLAIELSSLMLLLRQATFSVTLGAVALAASIVISYLSAAAFGLAGAAAGSVAAIYIEYGATLVRIALVTGTPVARLQDWKSLFRLLGCAAFAGTLAWQVARYGAGSAPPVARLALGAPVLFGVYLALGIAFGLRRNRSTVPVKVRGAP